MTAHTTLEPASADAALAALHALLDAGRDDAPEYRGGLSNHLPMLLHALHTLGASPTRLQRYAATYRLRLERRPPAAAPCGSTDWQAGLGRLDRFGTTRDAFAALLAREGAAATLRVVLPVLAPGVAAAAFHGLLRTAHALAAGHDGELAAGLAYWAVTHQPLLPATALAAPDTRSIDDWLGAVLALPAPPDTEAPLISLRMAAWARAPGFATVATALRVDDPTASLAGLARRAALVYAATGNFTVLHAVTSCQAMVTLLPWWPDPVAAVRHHAVALAAALRAARLDAGSAAGWEAAAVPAQDWAALVPPAIASDDDHVAKLVYACRALEAAWSAGPQDDVFRRAATRAVRATATRSAAPAPAQPTTAEAPQ